MKKIYRAQDPTHAHILLEILESHGIAAVIQGEEMFYLRGELPVVYPSICVPDDRAEEAKTICEQFDKNRKEPSGGEKWTCPKCGEIISSEFTDCWKCAAND